MRGFKSFASAERFCQCYDELRDFLRPHTGSVRARARQPVWPAGVGLVGSGAIGTGMGMDCVACGSAAVTERPERTAQGYRRFRCRDCGKQYNERSAGVLNRAQYPL